MLTFTRTFDEPFIRATITHPKIWPHVSGDGSPAREDFRPRFDGAFVYVRVRHANEDLGLFLLTVHNPILWEVHTCLLPAAWGARAAEAARGLLAWVWAETPCRRLMTCVPASNRLALRFALRAGLTEYGRNPRSFPRHGTLEDQILLGISKPE